MVWAKWSMCIMPLPGANNLESKGNTWALGRTCRRPEKRPCEAFYHPKQMSHGMLQSSKCCVGTCVGSLLPSQATRHWFVAAQWHAFRHPNFSIHYIPSGIPVLCWTYANEGCTETAKSFIYQLCMAWCPTSKTDLTLECKHGKPAWWKNSNGNRFVCWAFCAPWTWNKLNGFPLTCLGQHIMLLAKLAPISSYPALIRCRSVAGFRRPTFQYIITYLQASLHCAELMPMVFRRSTFQCFASFHIQLLSTSPETATVARNCESHSFIICVCLGVQHLKLIWHWNAKHGNLPHEGIRTETALCDGHSAPHEHGNKLNVSHWHFLANTSCYWRSLLAKVNVTELIPCHSFATRKRILLSASLSNT